MLGIGQQKRFRKINGKIGKNMLKMLDLMLLFYH
jgi:hypothetical protein